jgi:NAD(P) transhydrogenase subunit alpha
MKIGIPSETLPGERRVALIPQIAAQLIKMGHSVQVQADAGYAAGYPNSEYQERGATIVKDRKSVFKEADILFQVNGLALNPTKGKADLTLLKKGQLVIAMMDPLWACASI